MGISVSQKLLKMFGHIVVPSCDIKNRFIDEISSASLMYCSRKGLIKMIMFYC